MSPRIPSESDLKPGTAVPPWARLLPVVALVFAVLFQVSAPDPALVGLPTAIVPLLAALILGPGWTAIIAGIVMLLVFTPVLRSEELDAGDAFAVAVVWATGVGVAWARRRFRARLVTVESVAEAAQRAAVPELRERVGDLVCAGLYRSAQQGARVGGDLFDIRTSPFGTRMILGDVQGHGLSAVSTAVMLLSSFHEAILDEPDLGRIAARLERRIVVDADEGYIPELFASVLLVEFPEGADEMRLLSCGHPAPLVLRVDRIEEVRLKSRPLLGLRLEPRADAPPVVTIPFHPDEMLLAYSDGVSEARDADGRYYPLARHLNGMVSPPSPGRLIDFVWEDLTRFAARLDDDVSLLAVTRADRAEAPKSYGIRGAGR